MRHEVFQSEKFNFLTMTNTKEGLVLTGETKEGIELNDEVQNPNNGKQYLLVREIIERRDAKAYPKGNNFFYKILL
jgi:hypothetical protein